MKHENPVIYVDNNATTALAAECLQAMEHCLRHCYGNPSSMHRLGTLAKAVLNEARAQVALLLGATPAEIVFTSSATEANHMAILGGLALNPAKRHIITSAVEHPSTLMLCRHLETQGVAVTYLPVDGEGRLELAQIEEAMRSDTALVSLMWANNETGVLFPVKGAAEIAKRRGVIFHTDAVQAVGKIPIDLQADAADLLSLSGHKLHASKGVGALFVRKGLRLPPIFFGHQERGRRGGTENVASIVGFGIAAELARVRLDTHAAAIGALRERLEHGLLRALPFARVNGGGAPRLANTSNLRFGEIDAEIILDRLDKAGICASSGSACTAGGTEPSHVLLAMGQSREAALAAVRFSLSRYSTAVEVDRILEVLPGIVRPLAGIAA